MLSQIFDAIPWLVWAVFILLPILYTLLKRRRERLSAIREKFSSNLAEMRSNLEYEEERLSKYTGELSAFSPLQGSLGETKRLLDFLAEQMLIARTLLKNLRQTIEQGENVLNRSSFFRLYPLVEERIRIRQYHDWGTTGLTDEERGGIPGKEILIAPIRLGRKPENSNIFWTSGVNDAIIKLKEALGVEGRSIFDIIPQARVEELLAKAQNAGIHVSLVDDHSLLEDADVVADLYLQLQALKETDPVSFVNKVEELNRETTEMEERLERFLDVVNTLQTLVAVPQPDFHTETSGIDTSIELLWWRAQYELEILRVMLTAGVYLSEHDESGTSNLTIWDVDVQLGVAEDAFDTLNETIKDNDRLVQSTKELLEVVTDKFQQVENGGEQVSRLFEEFRKDYSYQTAELLFKCAKASLRNARRLLNSAERFATQHQNHRVKESLDDFDSTITQAEEEFTMLQLLMSWWTTLCFHGKIQCAAMQGCYEEAKADLQKYKPENSTSEPLVCLPPDITSRPTDLLAINASFTLQIEEWQRRIRAAMIESLKGEMGKKNHM